MNLYRRLQNLCKKHNQREAFFKKEYSQGLIMSSENNKMMGDASTDSHIGRKEVAESHLFHPSTRSLRSRTNFSSYERGL
jgi:hypothetical protein